MRSFLEGVGVWIDPVPQRARSPAERRRRRQAPGSRPWRGGSISVPLPVLDLGGGGFCGGRGGSLSSGTDSVSGLRARAAIGERG